MVKLRVKLVKSMIGRPTKHRKILRSLGLRRVGASNELPDSPDIRGKIFHVSHLVSVEEVK